MYNRELQIIDTQEKAYLLGLFYSDGNVGSSQIQSRISLREEDKELLFHLKKLFPFFYIHFMENRHTLELGNYSKKLQEDLISNGCLPRKSFENRNNLHIPDIDSFLIPHFIRGYFDGDGGCTVSHSKDTGKKTQKRVYIYSASKNFLEEISNILLSNNIKVSFTDSTNKKFIKIYKLSISTGSYLNFFNYLYNNSTIWMTRKRVKFQDILNNTSFFEKKKIIACKFCGSNDVVCDGWNYYKEKRQNYLCKSCKRHFSAPLSSNIQSGEGELLEG